MELEGLQPCPGEESFLGKGVWGERWDGEIPLIGNSDTGVVGLVVMGLQCAGQYREGFRCNFFPLSAGPPKLVHSAVPKTSRPMVAAFDYNPKENSPNMDVEVTAVIRCPVMGNGWQVLPRSDICFLIFPQAELPFRAGDVITVFGNMDDDGFYYVRPLLGKEGVYTLLYSGSPAGWA